MSTTGPAIFICYRRKDATPYARSIHERLSQQFGKDRVFMDLTIPPGMDFVDVIRESIGSAGAILVLIGPNWLVDPETGRKRLDDPEDYVLLEVSTAMQEEDLVVPVLVGGARMPHREDLPEPIRSLARRNAIEISDLRWDYDIGRLSDRLQQVLSLSGATPPITEEKRERKEKKREPAVPTKSWVRRLLKRPALAWGSLGAIVLIAGGIAFAALSGGGDDGGGGEGTRETSTFRTLSVGAQGPDVGRLEERLDQLGFNVEEPDQLFTTRTREAVFAFELCWGLPDPNGEADPDMQDAVLNSEVERGSMGPDTRTGTSGDDVIFLREGNDNYQGLGGNDRVCAGENEDVVDGGAGDDYLYGGSDNDVLVGGPGNDTLIGYKGDDRFDGGDGTDTCIVYQDTEEPVNCEEAPTQTPPPSA